MPTIDPTKLLAYVQQQTQEWRLSSRAADEWDGSAAAATAAEMMRDLRAAIEDGSLDHESWIDRTLEFLFPVGDPVTDEQRAKRAQCGDVNCPACRMPQAVKP